MDESVIHDNVDIAIIGAGPVGSALALGLAPLGLNILLLEARERMQADEKRTLALSQGSREKLESFGAWPDEAITTIQQIHVSDKGHFGQTILTAEEMDVPALGYVLRYNSLVDSVLKALNKTDVRVETASPVIHVTDNDGYAKITVGGVKPRTISASLAVLADGGKELTASLFENSHDSVYEQVALVAHVTCTKKHTGMAYERFTQEGPVALLPFEDRYALVWTGTQERISALLALADEPFLRELQNHFGYRAGQFLTVGPRNSYPLSLKIVKHLTKPHLICIGNAAQTMHPVAGQGFNLGLRDAKALIEVVQQFQRQSLGSAAFNDAYVSKRRIDRSFGIGLTHLLVTGFSNNYPIVSTVRNQVLSGLTIFPPLRRMLTKVMLYGVTGILK
ncbi:MAG: FAD-dependent monooxygenase [Betaproteobacteria bacterium]|nr:FAD-dependent monooxygenase [Betaproteobacteria bacterium]